MTRLTAEQAKNSVGSTNWNKLKNRTDAEIEAASAADPDARPFTPLELRQFKRGGLKSADKSSK